jgi:hypothetical protein
VPDARLRIAMAALGIGVALACVPGMAVRATHGAHVAVDEPQYLLTATSLWEDRDLDISDELAAERWRTYHEAQLPEQTKLLGDGRRLSPHDPLLPLLLAAPMGLGGWVAAKATMALLAGALAASMLWVAVRRLGVPLPTAMAGVACFALSAPLTVYGTQVYPEVPGALAVTLGLAAALAPPSRRAALGVAVAVAALPWLSVKYAPVAVVLASIALWRMPRQRAALLTGFGAGAVVAIVGHHLLYGGLTPYAVGDHFAGGEATVTGNHPDWLGRSRRLLALLVDRDYGLVAWQPAWLLVLPAFAAAVRRRSPLVLVLAAGWLMATFVALTMHGFWWPGRQVVVVLPVAVLLVVRWAPRPALLTGLVVGAAIWVWLLVDGLRDRITWVVHWHVLSWLRPLLVPRNGDVRLAAWTVVAAALLALGWRSVGGDEDALAGEGAHADDVLAHAHGDGAVR